MSTLLLRLAGPLQAWGSSSKFTRRNTDPAPTKSGVVGLLAAARGLRRVDPLEDLLSLRFGVRIDQPGRVESDFQTARSLDGKAFPLTYRTYLTDAVFLAAVEGDDSLIEALDEAVRCPVFPLYLGRRACPPAGPIDLGVRKRTLWEALRDEPWQASAWYRRGVVAVESLEVRIDAEAVPDDVAGRTVDIQHDAPVSFDPKLRVYTSRSVVRVAVPNPDGGNAKPLEHDPMVTLGGV